MFVPIEPHVRISIYFAHTRFCALTPSLGVLVQCGSVFCFACALRTNSWRAWAERFALGLASLTFSHNDCSVHCPTFRVDKQFWLRFSVFFSLSLLSFSILLLCSLLSFSSLHFLLSVNRSTESTYWLWARNISTNNKNIYEFVYIYTATMSTSALSMFSKPSFISFTIKFALIQWLFKKKKSEVCSFMLRSLSGTAIRCGIFIFFWNILSRVICARFFSRNFVCLV